jgi:hypothetical protein
MPIDDLVDGLARAYADRGDARLTINFIRSDTWQPLFRAPLCELDEEFEVQSAIDQHLLELRDIVDLVLELPIGKGRRCLIAAGGDGSESIDELYVALSPHPRMPSPAVDYLSALDKERDARLRGRGGTPKVNRILADQRYADALDEYEDRVRVWEQARSKLKLAVELARFASNLAYVKKPHLFRLIGADDAELLPAAERMMREARAKDAKAAKVAKTPVKGSVSRSTYLRRLRSEIRKTAAHVNAVLGFVGEDTTDGVAGRYIDTAGLKLWRDRKEKQRDWARAHEFIDPTGVRLPAAVVIETAAKARRAQWYAFVCGMRERARRDAWVVAFLTCSLPPEYHSNPARGACSYDPSLSPSAAAEELSRRWKRIASRINKKIRYFGIRTMEPHADGTPHLHFNLFVHPDDRDKLIKIFRDEFPDPPGSEVACHVKAWDEDGPADACSYVGAAVFGNMSAGSEEDVEDYEDRERSWAWASQLSVRKISFVGLQHGAMKRWRAAYSLVHSDGPTSSDLASEIKSAMRRRQWATAMTHLGLFRDDPTLVAVSEEKTDSQGRLVRRTVGWVDKETHKLVLTVREPRFRLVKTGAAAEVSLIHSTPRKKNARVKGDPPRPSGGRLEGAQTSSCGIGRPAPPPDRRVTPGKLSIRLGDNGRAWPDYEQAVYGP